MAEYLIQEETLTGIADAIRAKTGASDTIAVSAMASSIEVIESGGDIDSEVETCTITLNTEPTSLTYTALVGGAITTLHLTSFDGISQLDDVVQGGTVVAVTPLGMSWVKSGDITLLETKMYDALSSGFTVYIYRVTGDASFRSTNDGDL